MTKSPAVRIVEMAGTDEQLAVLSKAEITLSPRAAARARAFTASGRRTKPNDHSALWGPIIARVNERNGF